jgi:hypothetical protein
LTRFLTFPLHQQYLKVYSINSVRHKNDIKRKVHLVAAELTVAYSTLYVVPISNTINPLLVRGTPDYCSRSLRMIRYKVQKYRREAEPEKTMTKTKRNRERTNTSHTLSLILDSRVQVSAFADQIPQAAGTLRETAVHVFHDAVNGLMNAEDASTPFPFPPQLAVYCAKVRVQLPVTPMT